MKYSKTTAETLGAASLLGLSLALAHAPATAGEAGVPLWELGIGAALYHQPSYPGADVRTTTGFPFPYLIYRGDWFRIDRSLQGILYETRRVKVDLSAGATSLVDSDQSSAREGMPDLDATLEVGPALSLLLTEPSRPDNVWSRIALRTAASVDTHDWDLTQHGWVLDARLRYQHPLRAQALQLSTEVGVSVANSDYLGYFYNVAPVYATPTRGTFEAGSGYAGSRLGIGLSGVSGRWRWSLYGAYMNLAGTAFANSPLLESQNDFSLGATLAWMFWRSERRVTPKNTSPGNEFETPLFGL